LIKYILAALGFGVLAGYLNNNYVNVIGNSWVSSYLFDFSLVALLFVMGFMFGADKGAVSKLRKAGFRILGVPFSIALGSVVGGLVGGVLLGISIAGSMAVTAGFGWYTLAGPLVGQLFGADFGALGFVVNFLRELLTIVTIPLMARIDSYTPVALGGATTMDTTLPVIVRYCGSETLVTAFSSGFALSIMAPFAITAIAMMPK
jgi:uncharacterized membrane protein YbjE (DUF340 family)